MGGRDKGKGGAAGDRFAGLRPLAAELGHEINNPAAILSLGVEQIGRRVEILRTLSPEMTVEVAAELAAELDRVAAILADMDEAVRRIAAIAGELRHVARRLEPAAGESAASAAPTAPHPCPAPASAVEVPGRRARVLVVDDEAGLARAMAQELRRAFTVEVALSGEEALALLEARWFDAVLCDMRLPGVAGPEVFRHTRARDRDQAERFLFVTGGAVPRDEAEFLDETGQPVLEKPFEFAELWGAVERMVAERAPRKG